ncbi:hypothetical protein OG394_25125 [Kribbella sp. NBC_01245]|uniref:hypothetical protein n=1 Tax=Kribbella sp. NBC_01245 TaxID=2903578 RepID=UPI002E2D9715|nr:hypothetical protein [Kribbella sp. NBC_01245]
MTIDGDTLVIDDPTPEQQRRIVEEFVRRHAGSDASDVASTSASDAETESGGERRE